MRTTTTVFFSQPLTAMTRICLRKSIPLRRRQLCLMSRYICYTMRSTPHNDYLARSRLSFHRWTLAFPLITHIPSELGKILARYISFPC